MNCEDRKHECVTCKSGATPERPPVCDACPHHPILKCGYERASLEHDGDTYTIKVEDCELCPAGTPKVRCIDIQEHSDEHDNWGDKVTMFVCQSCLSKLARGMGAR